MNVMSLNEVIAFIQQYPFARNAIIVGMAISLCSSLLGVTLVLKRFSFIGDGLSHVAFGAMSIAMVLNLGNDMTFTMPVTMLCAILILKSGGDRKIMGDAAIAMLSVTALAIGYMVVNLFGKPGNVASDVCTTLFGSMSILTLSPLDVAFSLGLTAIVVVVFVYMYNRIFSITFDEDFARAAGTNVDNCNLAIAIIIAMIIVVAMKLVGALLVSALVIFPALTSMRVFHTFKSVTIGSAVIGIVSAFLGIILAIALGTPVGATIVLFQLLIFGIAVLATFVRYGKM